MLYKIIIILSMQSISSFSITKARLFSNTLVTLNRGLVLLQSAKPVIPIQSKTTITSTDKIITTPWKILYPTRKCSKQAYRNYFTLLLLALQTQANEK